MSAPATHPPSPKPGRRRWLPRVLVTVAAALTIGIIAALGGFEEVVPPPGETIPIAVGEQFNSGPWLVTVESAEIGYNLRGHNSLGEDRTLVLQVNARVENIDIRTRGVFGINPILELQDGPRLPEDGSDNYIAVRSLRDNALVYELQPGLPKRLAFLWELAPDASVPSEVTVLVTALSREYQYVRLVGSTWEYPDRPAEVTVSLVDRTATT